MIAVEANTTSSGFVGCVCALLPPSPSPHHQEPQRQASRDIGRFPIAISTICTSHRTSYRIVLSSSNISASLHLVPYEHDHRPTEICFPTVPPYTSPCQSFFPVRPNLNCPWTAHVPLHRPCSLLQRAARVSRTLYLALSCHTFDIDLATITYGGGCLLAPTSQWSPFLTTSCSSQVAVHNIKYFTEGWHGVGLRHRAWRTKSSLWLESMLLINTSCPRVRTNQRAPGDRSTNTQSSSISNPKLRHRATMPQATMNGTP